MEEIKKTLEEKLKVANEEIEKVMEKPNYTNSMYYNFLLGEIDTLEEILKLI